MTATIRLDDPELLGRALIRLYLNLRDLPMSATRTRLGTLDRAGAAMSLAMRIRRMGRVSAGELRAFAELAGLPELDVRLWALAEMERAGIVAVARAADGSLAHVDEFVGVPESVFAQGARLLRGLGPSALEVGALASSELLSYVPLFESDHRAALESAGIAPSEHADIFRVLAGLGVLRRESSTKGRETVLYSPYVWSTSVVNIAEFMHRLPPGERDTLGAISRQVAERPGKLVSELGDASLVSGARKAGLVSATRIVAGGREQLFAFAPSLDQSLASGLADVAHERKLFVAHILYGHRYGFSGTGRIRYPAVLVEALINKGRVGPTSSIRTDYPLLEAQGIVRVAQIPDSPMAYLDLVKDDVARDALGLLEAALGEAPSTAAADSIDGLWRPGLGLDYWSPERDRRALPDAEGVDAEITGSVILALRAEAQRRLRGEEV